MQSLHRLHPSDVENPVAQLHGLLDRTTRVVVVVEHDVARDRRQRLGDRHRPGAGEEGGRVVAAGPPPVVAQSPTSRTAPYLARELG
jgi:excinuclease ABC subunit A